MENKLQPFEIEDPRYGIMGVDLFEHVTEIASSGKVKETVVRNFAKVVSMTKPVLLSDLLQLPLEDLEKKREIMLQADGKVYYITQDGELLFIPKNGQRESLGRLTLDNQDNAVMLGRSGKISYTEYTTVPLLYNNRQRKDVSFGKIEQVIVFEKPPIHIDYFGWFTPPYV